jgi:hypothetical protein
MNLFCRRYNLLNALSVDEENQLAAVDRCRLKGTEFRVILMKEGHGFSRAEKELARMWGFSR